MLGKPGSLLVVEPLGQMGLLHGHVLNIVGRDEHKLRDFRGEFEEIAAAMKDGDNLPNTAASLEAKVKRRALLVAARHEGDARNLNNQSLCMLLSPRDVLRVYRMLLTRGYEPRNIRILVAGMVRNHLSRATKQNIMDSLEWLCHGAEAGDHRYFHFSGHGYAYEVEEGEGKPARVSSIAPTTAEHPKHSDAVAGEIQPYTSMPGSQIKFYREALLTEWAASTFMETLGLKGDSIKRDTYNQIDDEEFKGIIAKLPKGCILTMTLDCFHGGKMFNVNRPFPLCEFRGGAEWPAIELENDQPTASSNMYPSDFPRNLFVPPAFYLHSDFSYDPKVTMERLQGHDPLKDVQATVFVWSGYSTSFAQAGVFTSVFTDAVQELGCDTSCREVSHEISRKVKEATKDEDKPPLVQLWIPGSTSDEEVEVLMSEPLVI